MGGKSEAFVYDSLNWPVLSTEMAGQAEPGGLDYEAEW